MKSLKIIKYISPGVRCNIYTVKFNGETENEFNKFIKQFQISCREEVETILVKLETMRNKTGARQEYFKDEGPSSVYRLKGTKKLRLYCLRYGDSIIVIGGGNIKKVSTYQEDKSLYDTVKMLRNIDRYFKENPDALSKLFNKEDLEIES